MLCFYCTQTHTKLQSEFSREYLKTIFARLPPLASAARCGPHPLATTLDRVHVIINLSYYKACLSDITVTNISESSTHDMAVKTGWH